MPIKASKTKGKCLGGCQREISPSPGYCLECWEEEYYTMAQQWMMYDRTYSEEGRSREIP